MNVAYLKVTHGLRFHLFFFFSFFLSFLGAGLLMCFHGHSRPSFGRKHEVRAVAGGGMVRHFIYFFVFFWEQLGWCPSGSWCPTQTAYSAYRERRYWDYVPVMVSFFILPRWLYQMGCDFILKCLWFLQRNISESADLLEYDPRRQRNELPKKAFRLSVSANFLKQLINIFPQ